MKKNIVVLILIALVVLFCGGFSFRPLINSTSVPSTFSVEKIHRYIDKDLENYSRSELLGLIAEYQQIQSDAHLLAESARSLGWPETSETVQMAKTEYENASLIISVYQKQLDKLNAEWADKLIEYPEATKIWLYMKDLGWNDYVCAGIIGNLMTEVGGQTLNLQVCANTGNGYYGMCQWNRAYAEIWGADLETQCNFLRDTIQYEIDTFGYVYSKGFNFESFLQLTSARKAAKAFSCCYERCSSASYNIRQANAEKAYDYFVNQ